MTDNDTPEVPEPTPEETAAATAPEAETEEEPKFEFVEAPSFDIDYKGDCAYEVKVSVPTANEDKVSDEILEELRQEAEVPGFRRGRAPRKLIERKFAKAVRGDVTSRLVGAAFDKLIEDEDLSPIAVPDIDGLDGDEERKEGEPLAFTLKFEVRPRCELGKYRGIAIERPVFKVENSAIDDMIENMRSRFAVYETAEDTEAAEGDQVIMTFAGTIDGEEFAGGKAENYPYILGTKRFFPEFEEVLTGAKSGSELSCEVAFPEDYTGEEVRGKTAKFEIKVGEVKRRNLPELDDEFATQSGFESMADMREKIGRQLQENASGEGNSVAEDRVMKAIIEGCTFELPKSMVDSMAHDSFEERVDRLRQVRMPAAQIEQQEDELRAAAEREAVETIKQWVAVQEIAEAEGIEITDADFEQEAASISQRTGADVETVSKYLASGENRSSYEVRLLRTKVMAALLEHADVTDREMTPEELRAEMQAAEGAEGEDSSEEEADEPE
ncbi:MAG: trigger factor [Nitrospiraceae bacterium]|nr:trigger factor [Nitrospiraceae bacterium]